MRVPSAKPFFPEEDIQNILKDMETTLKSGMLTAGPNVKKLEEEFSKYTETKYAIAVNSGTAALKLALEYFNIKDKEVIVPTNSFVASANAVQLAGGTPILAEINPETLCIDPKDIEKKITPKTKGIMVVHLAGLPCPDIEEIQNICTKHNLFLLEDAAQAHGAEINGKKVGSLGDAACFSFFPTKQITTAEGGMITTNNQELAEFSKSVRNHGIDANGLYDKLGDNLRMSELNAILGIYQLKRLEEFIAKRNEIAKKYTEALKELKQITLFKIPESIRHSFYKFPIILNGEITAEELTEILYEKHNISLGTLYEPPIHLQPFYKSLGYKEGSLPNSEKILKMETCLPMFFELTDEQINHVIESLKQELK